MIPRASSRPKLETALVAPDVWRPAIEAALDPLDDMEPRIAQAVLSCCHSRHIGMTPGLAAGLANVLLPRPRRAETAWQDVRARLLSAAHQLSGSRDSIYSRQALQAGLMLGASMYYTVFRLAGPLIMAACRRIGRCYLFCEDPASAREAQIDAAAYQRYAADLDNAARELAAGSSADLPETFWQDRALTLINLTRQRARPDVALLPANSLPSTALLLRLQPDLRSDRDLESQQTTLARRRIVYDPRTSDAGADGVKTTHRLEELPRMVMSEFLYPKQMRLDRLLNEGYLVKRRPPRPIPLRDVFIAALCPWEVGGTPGGMLLKDCWFECMARLSQHLHQGGLADSELRWIEGDSLRRMRANALIVQQMGERLGQVSPLKDRFLRYQFMKSSGWFPDLLDPHSQYEPLQFPEQHTGQPDKALQGWARAAWQKQLDHHYWRPADRATSTQASGLSDSPQAPMFDQSSLSLERFTFVYVMLMAPASLCPADQGEGESRFGALEYDLRGVFTRDTPDARRRGVDSVGISWAPATPGAAGWRFAGNGRGPALLSRGAETLSTPELAERLIAAWIADITSEMRHA